MSVEELIELGDLVSAEYVTGISGTVATLTGIVIGLGEWEGKRTTSVIGFDGRNGGISSTMSSTMPVRFLAHRLSQHARDTMRELQRSSEGRTLDRLEKIAFENMGM